MYALWPLGAGCHTIEFKFKYMPVKVERGSRQEHKITEAELEAALKINNLQLVRLKPRPAATHLVFGKVGPCEVALPIRSYVGTGCL